MDFLTKHTTVNNPVLKIVAMTIFILLPIFGFVLGMKYQSSLNTPMVETVSLPNPSLKIMPTSVPTITVTTSLISFTSPKIVQPTITESYCAKAGERSVSNFDMTTGKINPNIKVKNCCPGLRNIAEKQSAINRDPDVCAQSSGVSYNLCSPCGNGVCDSQYEDHCNCPKDCK